MTSGKQEINLIHIEDLVAGFLRAYEYIISSKHVNSQPTDVPRFFMHSQDTYSIKEVVSIFQRQRNCQLHIRWGEKPERENLCKALYTDGKNLPGWRPLRNFKNSIKGL